MGKFLPTMKTALLALLLLVVVVAIEASPKKGGRRGGGGGGRKPQRCETDDPNCPDGTTCYDEDGDGRGKCLLDCESDVNCEDISSRRDHVCNDDGVCVRA